MASTEGNITLTASCLCKTHTFTSTLPKSALPFRASLCHCTSCRHMTGALYTSSAQWPDPGSTMDLSKLSEYDISGRILLYFCGTCSTPMFFKFNQPPYMLNVFTGALPNLDEDLVGIEEHIFVGDTGDGGASMWLRYANGDGELVPRAREWDAMDGEIPEDWPPSSQLTGYEKKVGSDAIPIWCRCRGVKFQLHRGNYEGKSKEELPWYIDPKTHKRMGGFCPCDSCRLSFGVDIVHWTFAELENISFKEENATEKSFPRNSKELKELVDTKDPAIGTLTYFSSSADVQRYFCSCCSACVFYAVDDRPNYVDVAIGVLDAPDGARAEGFLSWAFGGKVGHEEDMKGGWREGLLQRVQKEAERWREERGYPKNWRRVEREAANGLN